MPGQAARFVASTTAVDIQLYRPGPRPGQELPASGEEPRDFPFFVQRLTFMPDLANMKL